MKKLLILVLMIVFVNSYAFGMKQEPKKKKLFSKEWQAPLLIKEYGDPQGENIIKTVVVVTPEPTNQQKAAAYFDKNHQKLKRAVEEHLKACVSLMYATEAGPHEYGQVDNLVRAHPALCKVVQNPASKFIFSPGKNFVLERALGGDEKKWYFTELLEITVSPQASCGPVMVQCHNDQAGVHDKVYVSELERFYSECGAPKIVVKTSEKPALTAAELQQEGAILMTETADERLCVMANLFLIKQSKHKHLFPKK